MTLLCYNKNEKGLQDDSGNLLEKMVTDCKLLIKSAKLFALALKNFILHPIRKR